MRLAYTLPPGHLLVIPDTRYVSIPARLWRDKRALRYEQCTRRARSLCVVFDHQVRWDVLLCGAVAREWRHHDPVLQIAVTDSDRCE